VGIFQYNFDQVIFDILTHSQKFPLLLHLFKCNLRSKMATKQRQISTGDFQKSEYSFLSNGFGRNSAQGVDRKTNDGAAASGAHVDDSRKS
jgi:hypothetical protein